MSQVTSTTLWTALVTPFKSDGSVDLQAFEGLVERQVAAGVKGLLLFGSTGEAATLLNDEKKELFARAKALKGDALMMMGTTHNDTRIAIDDSVTAAEWGADALLIAPPYYNKPSQAGIGAHYLSIHEATNLPIVLYNIPSRVGVSIGEALLRDMAQWDRIVGLKEAAGDQLLAAIGTRAGLTVWSGDDPTILPYMSLGAIGGISVNGNLFPAEFQRIIDLYGSGKTNEAKEMALNFVDWYFAVFAEVNPTGIKAALAVRGLMENVVRSPLVAASEQNTTQISKALDALDGALI